jgi:hypothetical protein
MKYSNFPNSAVEKQSAFSPLMNQAPGGRPASWWSYGYGSGIIAL